MASPPPSSATSPPASNPLALPRQRPTLALPGQSSSRKLSITTAASNNSSAHPLRQTSFPPSESLEAQHAAAEDAILRFSPSQASQGSLEDEFSDTEIVSAISNVADENTGGPNTASAPSRKRKRGEKKPRGRPSKAASQSQHGRAESASVINGERTSRGDTVGAGSGGEDDEDDDDMAGTGATGRAPLYAGGEMTAQEFQADNEAKAAFRNYMENLDRQPLNSKHPSRAGVTVRDMAERYDTQYRAKLHRSDVRRLVNQTLSQSVPSNVVLVVSAYTKMFAMDLIGEARKVQDEWMGIENRRADGEENPAYEKVKRALDDQAQEEDNDTDAPPPLSSTPANPEPAEKEEKPNGTEIKTEPVATPTPLPSQLQTQTQSQKDPRPLFPGGAGGLQTTLEQCDRGPLLPDHLREALRRYKKKRAGGPVGFTGHSLEGRDVAAPRMGGRRLFR